MEYSRQLDAIRGSRPYDELSDAEKKEFDRVKKLMDGENEEFCCVRDNLYEEVNGRCRDVYIAHVDTTDEDVKPFVDRYQKEIYDPFFIEVANDYIDAAEKLRRFEKKEEELKGQYDKRYDELLSKYEDKTITREEEEEWDKIGLHLQFYDTYIYDLLKSGWRRYPFLVNYVITYAPRSKNDEVRQMIDKLKAYIDFSVDIKAKRHEERYGEAKMRSIVGSWD